MRARINRIIRDAIEECLDEGSLAFSGLPDVVVEVPKKEAFGDFSTNVAMVLAKEAGRSPREISATISTKISANPLVARCEVAGPGFINIFLENSYWTTVLAEILAAGGEYGRGDLGAGEKVQVEFVSANPTGPLHIGHGRGAAVGDALANILDAAGFDVTREFYINDVGRQMQTLGESVRARCLQLQGEDVKMPEDAYKGDYVREIARDFLARYGESVEGGGEAPAYRDFAAAAMLERIERDLADFGVEFDTWFRESRLYDDGSVEAAIEELREKGYVYEREGALWLKTSELGDDKDRVLKKADGYTTYFASDIAYHKNKVDRGFSKLVNVWGADHHGYEARVRAGLKALGIDDSVLRIIFIQLVSLLRGGRPVAMGKREGEFVTLRQVMDEVGADACRFFFLMRKADAQLDFDLDLAKSQAPENPVYYVQYCHARIRSIFDFAGEKGIEVPAEADPRVLSRIESGEEKVLIKHLGAFGEVIERAARDMEPHRVTFYLTELAGLFHPYYNRNRVVTDDAELTAARLLLCRAVKTVAANGLRLLGVSAPEKM